MNSDPPKTTPLPEWKVRKPRKMIEMPPRSELYSLPPLEVETVEVESLTSYIQRMAWAYRVNPRVLIAEAILPHLGNQRYADPGHLGSFSRTRSMSINGIGEVAQDWTQVLEQLTMRSDLRFLTLRSWANGLPIWGLQRQTPQWCPACYDEWREHQQPVYQPLLWTLQAVTICLRHSQPLVEHCPACQKPQSAIASKRGLGCCTQCGSWLGSLPEGEQTCEKDLLNWQSWIKQGVEELILAYRTFGSLPWHQLPAGINACVEAVGGTRPMGRIAGVPNVLFSNWRKQQRTPSFTYLLKMSYALDLSPLQLMTVEPERLKNTLSVKTEHRLPPRVGLPAPASKGDLDRIQAFLQAILEGEVAALPVRHAAHRLGVGEKFLTGRFPGECAQITARYLEDRAERAKKRVMLECAEIRQAVRILDEQELPLDRPQVVALLSNPNILRRPEAKATWQAICRERRLEP